MCKKYLKSGKRKKNILLDVIIVYKKGAGRKADMFKDKVGDVNRKS